MVHTHASSFRSTLDYLKQQGELVTVTGEVDPIYEIAGIEKALENGPALLFENIKGYPSVRNAGNIFSREDRVAKIFSAADFRELKFRFVEALKHPLPPVFVDEAPCQEVVIKDDIDAMGILPVIKHSEVDAGHILGGGVILSTDSDVTIANDISFKRMHFRGKDWASIFILGGTHLSSITDQEGRTESVPVTVNIGAPPSVIMVAGTNTVHAIMPDGTNELGIAGAFQGSPIELCKAKTVNAHAIANSEWVIEGYITTERVWESEESEKLQKRRVAPYFPEWSGYLGRATNTFKFQATAITHRKDNPIYYTPLANSYGDENMNAPLREACLYELAQRMAPGLVVDVSILHAFKGFVGAIFQVRKRGAADDAFPRSIVAAAIPTATLRLAIIVDEDVNIYDAEDVLWAIATRANLQTGVFTGAPGSIGLASLPSADAQRTLGTWSEGGLVIDATVPYKSKSQFPRTHYPVDRIDLTQWFSSEQIIAMQAQQCEHARFLASIGG